MNELDKRSFLRLSSLGLAGLAATPVLAAEEAGDASPVAAQLAANGKPGLRAVPARSIPVPQADLSAEAQSAISQPYSPLLNLSPADTQDWRTFVTNATAASEPGVEQQRKALGVSIKETKINGVRCFELAPATIPAAHRNQLVICAHGGGYVLGAGVGGAGEAALVSAIGGYRTISVDYRIPPDAPAPAAVDDMIAVWRSIARDHNPRRVAFTGTSAGGGLILATMLRAKQLGLPMPGAIAPSSPWADLTETGDSYRTNEWIDNVIVRYEGYLGRAAQLYAGGRDMRDPLISPVYGDYNGMPPTLLTAGTRDLFLSNTVRVHRKLRRANVPAELHVYEGISHAQLLLAPSMPETREAYTEITRFFDGHLAR